MIRLEKPKRGRVCNECGEMIPKNTFFFERSTWVAEKAYPIKSNICLSCMKNQLNLIPELEQCLKEMKVAQEMIDEII